MYTARYHTWQGIDCTHAPEALLEMSMSAALTATVMENGTAAEVNSGRNLEDNGEANSPSIHLSATAAYININQLRAVKE